MKIWAKQLGTPNVHVSQGMYNRIDTSFFPKKKLNVFTKLVYKQLGEALQSVKYGLTKYPTGPHRTQPDPTGTTKYRNSKAEDVS